MSELVNALLTHLREDYLPKEFLLIDRPASPPPPPSPQPVAEQPKKKMPGLQVAIIGTEEAAEQQLLSNLLQALGREGFRSQLVEREKMSEWMSDDLKVIVSPRPLAALHVKAIHADLPLMLREPHRRKGLWKEILEACCG